MISGLSVPAGVSIDSNNSKLYWYESGTNTISSSDLNGSNIQTVVSSVNVDGGYVEVDTTNSYLFFSDTDRLGNTFIKRTDLSGNNSTTIATLPTATTSFEGITADPQSQTVYFADSNAGTISSVAYTGGSVSTVTTGLSSIHAVAFKAASTLFYWDNTSTDGLWTTATNWVSDTVPTTGADVFFENDYGTGAETVNVNTSPSV